VRVGTALRAFAHPTICCVLLYLKPELLAHDALVEAVAGIEQHAHADAVIHLDVDSEHVAHLVMVGDGGDRALGRFQHLDPHARAGPARARRASAAAGTG